MTTAQRLPVIEPQGHGKPDHCSEHGDIDRNTSIAAHIKAEHGMSYGQWRWLQEAQDTYDRLALVDDVQKAITQSSFTFARRTELHAFVSSWAAVDK